MRLLWFRRSLSAELRALLDRKSAPLQGAGVHPSGLRWISSMPSEMGFRQFFHGFQPKFHGRTNDIPHAPVHDSVEQKTFVDIGRAEMTIAVADRAATAAPYSASSPRSARPVTHTVLSAAGAELAQIWRTLKKDLCDPYRPELHYMRGPGPKWREKHANASPPRSALALSLVLVPVAGDASLSKD
jgi:hypothetical protein